MDDAMNANMDDNDTFEIIIASDLHLGHNEKHPILGKDSFNAFDEILDIATSKKVDFVLLGGDLFDHNKPTLHCVNKSIETLQKHCTKDEPIKFKFEGDHSNSTNPCPFKVNFDEHSHVKISLPVFSIHGNHDDRTAHWQLAPLDVLSSTGLVNYFGFCNNLDVVQIRPIILSKGSTRIALYGLGYIPDEKLSLLFRQNKVEFVEAKKDCFCILVLHQNRVKRGPSETSYIKEEYLPKIFHLIIWGHEHDKKWDIRNGVYHLQPGSTVATSLKKEESGEKFVYHVKVCGLNLLEPSPNPISLKRVRPFVFKKLHVPLSGEKYNTPKLKKEVEEKATKCINEMIKEAGYTHHPELPLIRLILTVDHEDQLINASQIGKQFKDKVANYKTIILQSCKKDEETGSEEPLHMRENKALSIESALKMIFQESGNNKHKLKVISFHDLLRTVKEVNVDEDEAKMEISQEVKKTFNRQLYSIVEDIKKIDIIKNEDSVIKQLESYKIKTNMQSNNETENLNITTDKMDVQPGPSCSSQILQYSSRDMKMEKCDDPANVTRAAEEEIEIAYDKLQDKRKTVSTHSRNRKKMKKSNEEENSITKYFMKKT